MDRFDNNWSHATEEEKLGRIAWLDEIIRFLHDTLRQSTDRFLRMKAARDGLILAARAHLDDPSMENWDRLLSALEFAEGQEPRGDRGLLG
jgi:hypothetical protein